MMLYNLKTELYKLINLSINSKKHLSTEVDYLQISPIDFY